MVNETINVTLVYNLCCRTVAPSFSIVTQRLQDHNIGADNPLQSLPPHSIVSQDSQITNVITIRTVTEKVS